MNSWAESRAELLCEAKMGSFWANESGYETQNEANAGKCKLTSLLKIRGLQITWCVMISVVIYLKKI